MSGTVSLTWAPEGKRLAAGTEDGEVEVWDVDGRRLLWRKDVGSSSAVVSWSPDDRSLAIGDARGNVRLIRADNAGELRSLQRGLGKDAYPVFSPVAWSPDGTRLAAPGAQDSTIRVWEAATGKQQRVLELPAHHPRALSWSPDGKRLAVSSGDAVWIWSQSNSAPVRIVPDAECYSIGWSPDGRRLALGNANGRVVLRRIAEPATLRRPIRPESQPAERRPREGVTGPSGVDRLARRTSGLRPKRGLLTPDDWMAFTGTYGGWNADPYTALRETPRVIVFRDGRIMWREARGRPENDLREPQQWRQGLLGPQALERLQAAAKRSRYFDIQPDPERRKRMSPSDSRTTRVGLSLDGWTRATEEYALDYYANLPIADIYTRSMAVMGNVIGSLRPAVSERLEPEAILVGLRGTNRPIEDADVWPLPDAPVLTGEHDHVFHYEGPNARTLTAALDKNWLVRIEGKVFIAVWAPAIEIPTAPE